VKIAREPGQEFQYNNYNTSYLGLIIERATGKTVSAYMEEKLWSRMMEYEALFSIDSKRSGFEYMPSRLIARAIDYARFGRLILHEGNWNGKQLLPADWIREATLEDTTISREIYPPWMGSGCNRNYYTYQWWGHVNCDSSYNIFASGNLGQEIYILPEEEILIIHCGNSLEYYNSDLPRSVAEMIRKN
jgi:CubicO group peptidase (beta-lactamase class C family)